MYEIFGRAGPYGDTIVEAEEIIEQVRETRPFGWYRPDLEALKDTDLDYKAEDYILGILARKLLTFFQELTKSILEIFFPILKIFRSLILIGIFEVKFQVLDLIILARKLLLFHF